MEFLDGGHVNDVEYFKEHNLNMFEVTSKLGRLYSRMIFVTGFVHSDPHPGNILVRNNGHEAEIVLLDHGLYAVSNKRLSAFHFTYLFVFYRYVSDAFR